MRRGTPPVYPPGADRHRLFLQAPDANPSLVFSQFAGNPGAQFKFAQAQIDPAPRNNLGPNIFCVKVLGSY